MKKLLLVATCVFASVQIHAQQSVRLELDIKPNMAFEIKTEDKTSTITTLSGDKKLIDLISQDGTEYPSYETEEVNAEYVIRWKDGKKGKVDFELDQVKRLIRNFKGKTLANTTTEGGDKNIASGNIHLEGFTITKEPGVKYQKASEGILTMLNDLFDGGLSSIEVKLNQEFAVTKNRNMKLSNENEVDVVTEEKTKLVKIENNRAYFSIISDISSESKGSKFAEMKGKGVQEAVYNIEKRYMESMSGTVNVNTHIEVEGGLVIKMINNVSQKTTAKLK